MATTKQNQHADENWGKFWISQKVVFWRVEDGKFLLVKETDPEMIDRWAPLETWSFPGGHIDKDENVADALARELMEELGAIDYELLGPIRVTTTRSGVGVAYLGQYLQGEITLSDEHSEYEWYGAEEIDGNEKINPIVKEVIRSAVLRLKEREYLNDLQRLQADFSNYKRRQEESQKELRGFLIERFLTDLLPVMDNFRMATGHVPADQKDNAWVTGIGYIEQQLEKVLEENGVTTLAVSVGDVFDPSIHEAVEHAAKSEVGDDQVSAEVTAPEKVVKVLQNGYKIGERVVRPAKVAVA